MTFSQLGGNQPDGFSGLAGAVEEPADGLLDSMGGDFVGEQFPRLKPKWKKTREA